MEWDNCHIHKFNGGGPVIEIKDDCESYCATIPEGMPPRDLVAEFAQTYDFNGEPGEIICSARIYEDVGDSWREINAFGFRVVPYTQPIPGATAYAQFC
jgi:hypothetical protein